MTVLENLQMGASSTDPKYFDGDVEEVFSLFPILRERKTSVAAHCRGEQQMLAIARALMSRPRLFLLDEPSLGLAPLVVRQIFDVLRELNDSRGLTVFPVEQNAYHALKLADRGYVMVNGLITLTGSGKELLGHEEVRAAVLKVEPAEMDPLGLVWEVSLGDFLLVTVFLGGGVHSSAAPLL